MLFSTTIVRPIAALACCVTAALSATAAAQRPLFDHIREMIRPIDGDSPALAIGDVDGDGDVDAMVVDALAPDRLLLNGGTAVFVDATEPGVDPANAKSIAFGDVDGDGDLDLFAGTGGTTIQNRLYLNDGTGVFEDVTAARLPVRLDNTYAVALGDVDGDGDLDVVFGTADPTSSRQHYLYLNDGSGVFTDVSETRFPETPDRTYAVAMGDVDADGDLDVLIGTHPGARNRLYLNDGAGFFSDATSSKLPPDAEWTETIELADVDGDGDLDAWLGNYGRAQDRLYSNDGTGTFSDVTATHLPARVAPTVSVALADVDGDGDPDALVGGNDPSGEVTRLYFNDGTGVFAEVLGSTFPTDAVNATTVVLTDLDRDGDRDALLGVDNYTGPPIAPSTLLYLNDGDGRFSAVTTSLLPLEVEVSNDVALGDVDADGDLDALIGNTGQNRLYRNDGGGVFADVTASSMPAISDTTVAVQLGDLDGDGDLDAMMANDGANRVYSNAGGGVFVDVTAIRMPPNADRSTSLALGDVDGDGDLDALVGNFSSRNRLYLNDGSSAFSDVTATLLPLEPSPWRTNAVALGDVDGDGDLDALIGTIGFNRLYLNDGKGVFSDFSRHLPTLVESTYAVALADLDGDGDLDAFIGNGFSEPRRVYRNNGVGEFSVSPSGFPRFQSQVDEVAVGDLDEDGDVDVLLGNRLYLNDGAGAFAEASTAHLRAIFTALGDVDGDGDVDALGTAAGGPNQLLANLRRHLAWRGLPRVGKPLVLEVYGPPAGIWVLAVELGPGQLLFAGTGLLDDTGRAAASFSVPASPALVGASIRWRAAVAFPFSLTNPEITTFTNL